MTRRPLILVTNDDGVLAPGIEVLAQAAANLGGEVVVCAPETERSGASHSITLHTHLRATPVRERWYAVTGSPVDCVYLGALQLCERVPDLVLSGVNPGYNLGTDVFYSGTVGAAAEGFLRGASAMAVSVEHDGEPSASLEIVHRLAHRILAADDHLLWNVNIPPGGARGESDLRVTRLGQRDYHDGVDTRHDRYGRPYYWIGGPPTEGEHAEGEDTWAILNGLVSVTPLELDITARDLTRTQRILEIDP